MEIVEGRFDATGRRFALVVSRFNSLVTEKLLEGARDGLVRHGAKESDLTVVYVPGAFEIPLIAKKLAGSNRYAAVIALGAVIRGSTPHFDQVVSGVTGGVAEATLSSGIPVIFGVLTTDTLEQALDRSGAKSGNKGFEAALTAIEMASVLERLP